MKKILILTLSLFLLFFMIHLFSEAEKTVEVTKYNGKLKQIGDNWFLNTGEDFFELSLAPSSFLAENKIELVSKSKVSLNGNFKEDVIDVFTIFTEKDSVNLRDEFGNKLWEMSKIKPYLVNAKRCIGCRLCTFNCPTNAIEMVNGVAVIDADNCIACGICADGNGKKYRGCPVGAISQIE